MFDINALNKLYEDLSAPNGMNVSDFHKNLKNLFEDERSEIDLNYFRLGRPPWKKLRDEICPVSGFLKYRKIETGQVRFPLDNNTPDCWLINNGINSGIEVTIERGKERHFRNTELIETGMGRGFLGIQDDAPREDFEKRISKPRTTYTTDQALQSTKDGILRCLSRKNNPKYEGVFYLLIQTDFSILPKERWITIIVELQKQAENVPFQQVHVIGNANQEPWGFQIK